MSLAQRKRVLRTEMAARRRRVTRAEADAAAARAADRLLADPAFAACTRLGLYSALRGELPTGALAHVARSAGKTLLWPRVEESAGLVLAASGPEDLVAGAWGIPAPSLDHPAVLLGEADLVLVPGLAFDARGRRLGRGGGHYDRLIAAARPGARFVGAGYGFQWVEEVPSGPEDRAVHAVLTEEELRWLTRGAIRRSRARWIGSSR